MENEKIPKIIHYCWFGKNPKPEIVLKCINTWKNILPDYKIKEWNEDNFDIENHRYTKLAYKDKKWAFVSDYARLFALYNEGGIYLDTDMYVLKSFDNLLDYNFFLGMEDDKFMNVAIFGSKKGSVFSEKLLEEYDNLKSLETIPKVVTRVYNNLTEKEKEKIKLFSKNYFYPFSMEDIKKFNYKNAPYESYVVHLWNYSWGHPINKIIKKIGIHKILKKITEKLGIKNIIKNAINMK
jgi:mannosyltransferase OCH1-like enzyme